MANNDGNETSIKIILYTLITEKRAFTPIRRGPIAYLRNRTRRSLELASWRLLGLWRGHYSTFEDFFSSNRGDIAIRMGAKRQLVDALAGRNVEFTEVAWGDLGPALNSSPAVDLVVIAGGGFLFADVDGRLPARLKDDVKALAQVSCPIVATSIGLNQLIAHREQRPFRLHQDSRGDLDQFLSRLTLCSVRDATTQRAIALECKTSLPVIVDPAFLLARDPHLSAQLDRSPETPVLLIGLNIAFHGPFTATASHRLLPIIVRVLKRLQTAYPCRYYYFAHSDGERFIAKALGIAGVAVELVNEDTEAMLETYRRMDIHIAQMLHSAILAMSVGTPALNLAYDVKSAGFFELFGLSNLCLDVTEIGEDEIVAAIGQLIANRKDVAATIRTRRTELASDSRDFYAAVASLVANSP